MMSPAGDVPLVVHRTPTVKLRPEHRWRISHQQRFAETRGSPGSQIAPDDDTRCAYVERDRLRRAGHIEASPSKSGECGILRVNRRERGPRPRVIEMIITSPKPNLLIALVVIEGLLARLKHLVGCE